jgi:hypothetical protein
VLPACAGQEARALRIKHPLQRERGRPRLWLAQQRVWVLAARRSGSHQSSWQANRKKAQRQAAKGPGAKAGARQAASLVDLDLLLAGLDEGTRATLRNVFGVNLENLGDISVGGRWPLPCPGRGAAAGALCWGCRWQGGAASSAAGWTLRGAGHACLLAAAVAGPCARLGRLPGRRGTWEQQVLLAG